MLADAHDLHGVGAARLADGLADGEDDQDQRDGDGHGGLGQGTRRMPAIVDGPLLAPAPFPSIVARDVPGLGFG